MTTVAQPPVGDNPELWLQDGAVANEPEDQKRVALFDILLIVARQKRLVLAFGLVFAVITAIFLLLTPRLYRSTVMILPPEQTASHGMGGSLQDLSMALASSEGVSFKSSEDFWAAILKGRTIAYDVIKTFNLQQEYGKKNLTETRAMLDRRTSIETDKAGLLNISVEDTDKYRAARIANGYVDAMHRLEDKMSLTDAGQRRLFFQRELSKEKDALGDAEFHQVEVEKKTGVIAPGGQTSEAVNQIADLRAHITEKSVELRSLQTAATDQNPEVQRLKQEIAAEQEQLKQLQDMDVIGKPGDIGPASVPSATLEYIRATREVRYHEVLYEALARQLEAARMDESRTAPVIQIVDPAVPADKHAGLPRIVYVIAAGIFGMIVGLVFAVLRQAYRNLEESPENGAKLRQLKQALSARG